MAAALAIAAHEVLAGLVPASLLPSLVPAERVVRARVARIEVRPAPSAVPSPPAVILTRVAPIAYRPVRIARSAEGRAAAPHARRAAATATVSPSRANKPVWDTATAATTGTAQLAAQSGNATAGTGDAGGNAGNGTGSATGTEPCGFVEFSDPHGSRFEPRTRGFYVDIRMSVHFADGSTQSLILDYPWYYPSEAANPWSSQNLRDPNFPTRFQRPPADKIAEEPELVRYVMQHSTADGLTLLSDCPQAQPQ